MDGDQMGAALQVGAALQGAAIGLPSPAPQPAPLAGFGAHSTATLDALIVQVQGIIENPTPNRFGIINDAQRGRREYSYTTLDRILDLARGLLSERGILVENCPLRVGKEWEFVTRFVHAETGQYRRAAMPIFSFQNFHEFTAQCTMARRQNMQNLLNISTETDTDGGNVTSEHSTSQAAGPPAPRRGDAYDQMLDMAEKICCREKPSPEYGLALIKAWTVNAALADMRYDRDSRARWETLEQAICEALEACFGTNYAEAWISVLQAKSIDDLDIARVEYDTEHKGPIEKLRASMPTAVAHLTTHLITQAKALEARIEVKAAMENEVGAVEDRAEAEKEARFFVVYDWTGELSGRHDDPVLWAERYAEEWQKSTDEQRTALHDNNGEALAWIGEFPDAVAVLDAAMTQAAPAAATDAAEADDEHDEPEPPSAIDTALEGDDIPSWDAPPAPTAAPIGAAAPSPADDAPLRSVATVAVPRRANGGMLLLEYNRAIEDSLAAVCDVPTMEAWEAANAPTYMADDFPVGTRIRVMKSVTARKRALGLRPGLDG